MDVLASKAIDVLVNVLIYCLFFLFAVIYNDLEKSDFQTYADTLTKLDHPNVFKYHEFYAECLAHGGDLAITYYIVMVTDLFIPE